MKRFVLLICALTLFLSLPVFSMELEWASDQVYSIIDIGKDIGLVYNEKGSAVINKYCQIVTPFTENQKRITPNGLVAVLGDNGYIGFINNKGEQVTEFIYDAFSDTHEKSHITQIGYLSHLTGFPSAGDGSSDLIPVSINKKFGYINSYGTTVIPHKYEYAYGFHQGIAMICADGILSDYGTYTNGKYGFIKETGEEILPPDSYWIASYFQKDRGYASAGNGVGDSVLIDKDGNIFKCDNDGFAPVADYIFLNSEYGRYSVVDKNKNTVIPWTWCYGIELYNNRFIYNNGIYNLNNELIYQAPEGASLYTVSNDDKNFMYLRVPHPEIDAYALIGCLDMNGNTVIEPIYQSVLDLGEGIIYARSETENFLFDYNGKQLMKLNGQVDYDFSHNGFFAMRDFDSMKFKIAVNPLVHPKIYLNKEKVQFSDAYPFIENQRTLVPLRAVFEKLGAEVLWDDSTSTATVKKDDKVISMTEGRNIITVNGVESTIDVSPKIIDDRTYIPLRAFSENLGFTVNWDENTYEINIGV